MNPCSDSTEDSILWQQFKAGDRKAFAVLFKKYSDLLLNYGLTLGADRDTVKDCLQDLYISLWQSRAGTAEVKSVKFYLLTCFRHRIFRSKAEAKMWVRWKPAHEHQSGTGEVASAELSSIDLEGSSLREQLLMQLVNQLPPRQKEAVFLRFFQGFSYEEITQIMSLNNQVVRNVIHRAIKTLRAQLAKVKHLVFQVVLLFLAVL